MPRRQPSLLHEIFEYALALYRLRYATASRARLATSGDEPLAGRQVVAGEHRSDRGVTHRGSGGRLRQALMVVRLKAIASTTRGARDGSQADS